MEYVTIIEPVLEITLSGSVASASWQDLLQKEDLPVVSQSGQTNVLISVVDSKFRGIPFRELSVSVQVVENRFFLAHAYNSIALFAFAERVFFQTPYYKGTITAHPHHIALDDGSTRLFETALPADAVVVSEQWECNELLIHLPRKLRKKPNRPHYFHARLEGDTKLYRGETASIQINAQQPIWELLKISNFQMQEWRVRTAARHSKSKTFEDKV